MRSWMFVPGNRPRYVEKARGLPLDVALLDLEDGVPVEEKAAARALLAEVVTAPWDGPSAYVRVNSTTSPWFADDVAAVVRPGLAGVCVPKVESPEEVREVAARLLAAERAAGVPPGQVRVVAAVESANALLRAREIAQADARVVALIFGAEDFALDLGLGTAREAEARELLHARSALVVAAAAARVLSIDGVFPDLEDEDGLLADIVQARRLGFDAKSTFNPRQVEHINRIFSPQPDELDYARRVVAAFEEAQARGDGSVAVGGQLVDMPIVRRAMRLLETAESAEEARR